MGLELTVNEEAIVAQASKLGFAEQNQKRLVELARKANAVIRGDFTRVQAHDLLNSTTEEHEFVVSLMGMFPGVPLKNVLESITADKQIATRVRGVAYHEEETLGSVIDNIPESGALVFATSAAATWCTYRVLQKSMQHIIEDKVFTRDQWQPIFITAFNALEKLYVRTAPVPDQEPVPVPLLLYCPLCHTRHVDEGEFADKVHHTHSCQNPKCGHTWRPAVVPTVGVWTLPGFLNDANITGQDLVGRKVTFKDTTDTGTVIRWYSSSDMYDVEPKAGGMRNLRRSDIKVV